MEDIDIKIDESLRTYWNLEGADLFRINNSAIAALLHLLKRGAIETSELGDLLAAIPPQYDDKWSADNRKWLKGLLDYCGYHPYAERKNPVGRPKRKRITSRDVTTEKVTGERLEAALRKYWKGRKTNNAEMGRVIACLEYNGYIKRIRDVGMMATVEYIMGVVKRKDWRIKNILKGYNEVFEYKGEEFLEILKKCDKIILLILKSTQ